ncbi:MAG TPA: Sua5/YciO/YrdC/YwlC family protein [Solirubrobacteraceae bacterium]|nr:Sua5/YciO/YrdC/YwlC family protein [Solirubrobacteraceae bacterium]
MSTAKDFDRCIAKGGVVLFPADTVYGIACDPRNRFAVERLHLLKQRPLSKPSAVMFFELDAAFAALPELGGRTRAALGRLMPGAVTALLPNPAQRFGLACGDDPTTLGLRVPDVPLLRGASAAVLQSSANRAGGPEARRLADVHPLLRAAADLEIDGGELPGVASTVIDLRGYERGGSEAMIVVREGAVSREQLAVALDGQYHFNPETYADMIREDIPQYDEFQRVVVEATGEGASSILDLGTGTGETASRLLAVHPGASLVGVDESPRMLDSARDRLAGAPIDLRVARLQDPLPDGRFELVASALAVHHLDPGEKADLFARVRAALAPGGRFVLGDVMLPRDGSEPLISLTPGYDKPDRADDQLRWLAEAGFADARIVWAAGDLAVVVASS